MSLDDSCGVRPAYIEYHISQDKIYPSKSIYILSLRNNFLYLLKRVTDGLITELKMIEVNVGFIIIRIEMIDH